MDIDIIVIIHSYINKWILLYNFFQNAKRLKPK